MRTFDYEIRETQAQNEDATYYSVVRRNQDTGELEVLQGEFVPVPTGGMIPHTFRLNAPGFFDQLTCRGWGFRDIQCQLQSNVRP